MWQGDMVAWARQQALNYGWLRRPETCHVLREGARVLQQGMEECSSAGKEVAAQPPDGQVERLFRGAGLAAIGHKGRVDRAK
jgi:hypothetical protein